MYDPQRSNRRNSFETHRRASPHRSTTLFEAGPQSLRDRAIGSQPVYFLSLLSKLAENSARQSRKHSIIHPFAPCAEGRLAVPKCGFWLLLSKFAPPKYHNYTAFGMRDCFCCPNLLSN